MRVKLLIIEDNSEKFATVCSVLLTKLTDYTLEIERAHDYQSAITALSTATFDAVILDIFLPAMGGAPSPEAARNIIQLVHSGAMPGAPIMFGLTDHMDLLAEDMAFFEANLFHVLRFDWIDTMWAQLLSARIEVLLTYRGFSTFKIAERFYTDVCIITARREGEYDPIRKAMKWVGPQHEGHELFPGLRITRGAIELSNGARVVATLICVGEKGLAPTAAVTATALLVLRPRLISMLGMCCAFTHVSPHPRIGDVCVASEAASWDAGRYEKKDKKTEFFPEIRTVTSRFGSGSGVDVAVENLNSGICRSLGSFWAKRATRAAIPEEFHSTQPKVRTGQFLSGLSVVDSPSKKKELARRFSMGLALDMEVHGFYSACAKSPLVNTKFVAIKGVADLGDGEKQTGRFDGVQPFASKMSWITLDKLIAPMF